MEENINKDEKGALKELQEYNKISIEIKKADKSNMLVTMDKEQYKEKLILEQHLHEIRKWH